jgi:hypothetical protein
MKTMFSVVLFAIVSMLVVVPSLAQNPPVPYSPPGYYVNWTINLYSPSVIGASGIAQYVVVAPSLHPSPLPSQKKGVAKLSVECEYLAFPDLTPLDIFVGPGTAPSEPFGKLVGTMQVKDGSAAFISLRPPVVKPGSTVAVVRNGVVIMTGSF